MAAVMAVPIFVMVAPTAFILFSKVSASFVAPFIPLENFEASNINCAVTVAAVVISLQKPVWLV